MLPLLLGILTCIVLIAVIAALGYRRDWQWTGVPAEPGDGTPAQPARPAKTMWDWLQLLIVPFVLALAAFGLNLAQDQRNREDQQERAREDTLRAYLQQMSDLITDHGLRTRVNVQQPINDLLQDARTREGVRTRSRVEPQGDVVQRDDAPPTAAQTLARTLTLVALRQLDPVRKGLVVQFLKESNLITVDPRQVEGVNSAESEMPEVPKVNLNQADLRGAVMPRGLSSVEFDTEGAWSNRAADFSGADLRDADFHEGYLYGVSFRGTDLRGADFTDAQIPDANYDLACLSGTRFVRARWTGLGKGSELIPGFQFPPRFAEAEGRGIDFTGADLTGIDLRDAELTGVNLDGAKGAQLPPGWTRTGKPMSDTQADRLCRRFPPDP